MEFFRRYLRQHRLAILLFILSWGLLAASFALYGLPLAAVAYPALLSMLLCLAAAVWDYTRTLRRHRKLSELQTAANAQLMDLPDPASGLILPKMMSAAFTSSAVAVLMVV